MASPPYRISSTSKDRFNVIREGHTDIHRQAKTETDALLSHVDRLPPIFLEYCIADRNY
jgi:hypothetical protein